MCIDCVICLYLLTASLFPWWESKYVHEPPFNWYPICFVVIYGCIYEHTYVRMHTYVYNVHVIVVPFLWLVHGECTDQKRGTTIMYPVQSRDCK